MSDVWQVVVMRAVDRLAECTGAALTGLAIGLYAGLHTRTIVAALLRLDHAVQHWHAAQARRAAS